MGTHWKRGALGGMLVLALMGCDAEVGDLVEDLDSSQFAAVYNSPGFASCSNCHTPDAPGKVEGTENTQDWTDQDTAYAALQGTASGLIGNFEGCNGVPFIGDTVETSLIVAALDQDVRDNFAHPDFPNCTPEAISNMQLKVGGTVTDDDLNALKTWIENGAQE